MEYPDLFTEAWLEAHKNSLSIDEGALGKKGCKRYFDEYINGLIELENIG